MPNRIYLPFDPKQGYPAASDLYYECADCCDEIPSLPVESVSCRCGNILIDVDNGRVSVRDEKLFRIFQSLQGTLNIENAGATE